MGNDNLSEKPVIMEYLSELIHAQMEDRIPQPLPKGVTLEELQETAKKGQICYSDHCLSWIFRRQMQRRCVRLC